jgi:hypothetical protein
MTQRYVFVLANEAGLVLDEPTLISQKVQQMKNPAKASSTTKSGKPGAGAAIIGGLQTVGSAVAMVENLSSDASPASGLTQESSGGDWTDLLADSAPAIGAAVGSIIPGVGTIVGGGIGTGISLLNKLID